jgi:hypothetical protein
MHKHSLRQAQEHLYKLPRLLCFSKRSFLSIFDAKASGDVSLSNIVTLYYCAHNACTCVRSRAQFMGISKIHQILAISGPQRSSLAMEKSLEIKKINCPKSWGPERHFDAKSPQRQILMCSHLFCNPSTYNYATRIFLVS